jgi:hypothetical protein
LEQAAARRRDGLPLVSWSRRFDVPVELSEGGELGTLLDAGRYVEALPKSQHNRPEWQTSIHFLLMAAEGSLPVIFANITLLKALNAGQPKPTSEPRKKAADKYRIVR